MDYGAGVKLLDANITRILREPMTAKSVEGWSEFETSRAGLSKAMGTDTIKDAAFSTIQGVKALPMAVQEYWTKRAEMDGQTRDELTALVEKMTVGDSVDFKSGDSVDVKYTHKIDPAALTSLTLKGGGGRTRDVTIRHTDKGWEVGGLKGWEVRAGISFTAGLRKGDAGGEESGLTAQLAGTVGAEYEGGRQAGGQMTLPDTEEGRKALVSVLLAAIDNNPPGTSVLELAKDPTDVRITKGDGKLNAELAGRMGGRNGKDANNAGAMSEVALTAAGGMGKTTEHRVTLDNTCTTVETRKEIELGVKAKLLKLDLTAIKGGWKESTTQIGGEKGASLGLTEDNDLGAQLANSIGGDKRVTSFAKHAGEAIDDKVVELREKAGETVGGIAGGVLGKEIEGAPTTIFEDNIAKRVGKEANSEIGKKTTGVRMDGLGVKMRMSVERSTTVEHARQGTDDYGQLTGAMKTVSINADQAYLKGALLSVANGPTREMLMGDLEQLKALDAQIDLASEKGGTNRRIEIKTVLSPPARERAARLNEHHKALLEDGHDELARIVKKQAEDILNDEDNYLPTSIDVFQITDTTGTSSYVPLGIIDFSRNHGVVNKRQLEAMQFTPIEQRA